MAHIPFTAMRRSLLGVTPLALALLLPACGDSNNNPTAMTPTPAPIATATPTPTPTATQSSTSRNVSACLNQVIPGTGGATPASLVVPDTIKLNLANAAAFPNGRRLQDPVVDITLAVLFLDLSKHSAATFANLPLNPPRNDQNGGVFLSSFPFVLPPQGTPPLATGTGTSFNIRTDAPTAYTRVDREGQPAVATAVIGQALKNAYNDANPVDDASGAFVPEIVNQLTLLHNGLADDLIALGLTPCST